MMIRRHLALPILLLAACGRNERGAVAHGTVEVTQVDLAPTQPARVQSIRVQEGDRVSAGDTVAVLTQATLDATLSAQQARLAAAEANLRDLQAGSRAPEIQQAADQLSAAEAEAVRTARDLGRTRQLADSGVVARQQLDAASSAAQAAAGRRDAARAALDLARQGSRPERIRAAQAEVQSARAAVAQVHATAGDLVLTAPVPGVVLGRWAEPGEVLAAGAPALTLGQTARPWVRVYLSAAELAAVHVGQRATITVPGTTKAIPGHVEAINPQAEFTPRVALSEKERADLLFGVKVAIDDTTGAAKPGLDASVQLLAGSAP